MTTPSFVSPSDDLEDAARSLEGQAPEDILAFASRRYAPRIAIATGFGPEGCVLLDLIGRHRLSIPVFTLDTGLLFPETHALWRRLEVHCNLSIRSVRPTLSLPEQARAHGPSLWESEPDRCCALRKVEPLRAALVGLDAWVSAIRREQTADRAHARVLERDPRFGLVKVNPLAAWTDEDVWRYVHANDVPVNPLHAKGYPSIGCAPCTSPVRPGEPPRAGRWRRRSKSECGLHVATPLPDPTGAPAEQEAS